MSTQPVRDRPLVLALLPDPQAQTRLRAALRGSADVQVVEEVHEAIECLRGRSPRASVVVVEPTDGAGRSTAVVVQAASAGERPIPVVAYCSLREEGGRGVLLLTQAGVHDVTFQELEESSAALRQLLAEAEQTCGADLIFARVRRALPRELEPFFLHALMYPAQSSSVGEVAAALGMHRRTMGNLCRRRLLPPPQELLVWARLLLAAYLLGARQVPVDSVALRLHYPSTGALRNKCRRYLARRAAELREPEAFDAAVAAFLARLAEGRATTGDEP